jgi:hypothetical protein
MKTILLRIKSSRPLAHDWPCSDISAGAFEERNDLSGFWYGGNGFDKKLNKRSNFVHDECFEETELLFGAFACLDVSRYLS